MSSASSPGSKDSGSASSAPEDSVSSPKSSRTPTASGSSNATGRTSPASPTCAKSELATFPEPTSSRADSPARTSASPAAEQALKASVRVFGRSTPVSLGSYDPGTSSWRTSQLSLLEDLTESSPTFTRSGMTRSGIVFQLQPLAPLTRGTASGLLPTLVARDDGKTPEAHMAMKRRMPGGDRGGRGDLIQQVRGDESPSGHFKTPTAAPFSHGGSGGELHKQVAPSGGPLNPQWVAWLMGFPIDWLSFPPSETRSFRRSRSGSATESSNGKAA